MPQRSNDTKTLTLSLQAGDIVAGKFRVEGLIGEGGMGIVVAATHLALREPVALKFLRPELLAYPELVTRFAFEARAAAKVKSEHVARVLDVGDVDGIPFMVLEHLDGRNLGMRVVESGPLSLRDASEIIIQVCEALAEAHALGIVHRDVKPENLFLIERGGYRLVKLIDFGISKAEPIPPSARGSHSRSAATADEFAVLEKGEIMGSPSYMSPEQLTRGALIDARTDIWSLGAVLYELLTGDPMFDPTMRVHEIMSAVLTAPIPSVLDKRPELPLSIAGVLSRCLARDPELRFQSAAELAVALLPFAPRRARESAERAVSQVRSSGGSEPRLPSSEAPRAPSSEPRLAVDSDPMLLAMPEGIAWRSTPRPGMLIIENAEDDLRTALKPAPIPMLPALSVSSSAPTVRIERVPAPLESSPATSRSVEPTALSTVPRVVVPAVTGSRYGTFLAAAAVLLFVCFGTFARLGPTALGGWGVLRADPPLAHPEPTATGPAVKSVFEGNAEPAVEVLVIDVDAAAPSAPPRRERRHRVTVAGNATNDAAVAPSPCDNPYGCDEPR